MGNGLLNASGKSHQFQRKLLGKSFSSLSIKKYYPVFRNQINILIEVSILKFTELFYNYFGTVLLFIIDCMHNITNHKLNVKTMIQHILVQESIEKNSLKL